MDRKIKLTNIHKKYGNQVVFDNFNLDVEKGEFLALSDQAVVEKQLY